MADASGDLAEHGDQLIRVLTGGIYGHVADTLAGDGQGLGEGIAGQANASLHTLSHDRMRCTKNLGISDGRILEKRVFDLDRRNVLSTADDDILDPARQNEQPVLRYHPQITGMKPSVRIKRLLFLRKSEITVHCIGALYHYLPYLTAAEDTCVFLPYLHFHTR